MSTTELMELENELTAAGGGGVVMEGIDLAFFQSAGVGKTEVTYTPLPCCKGVRIMVVGWGSRREDGQRRVAAVFQLN